MAHVAFARSDTLLRARALAVVSSPEALAKLTPERQSYVVYASDAMAWWIDDQDNAGEDVDLSRGYRRHEAVIMLWAKSAPNTPARKDVFLALRAQRAATTALARIQGDALR